MKKNKIKNLSKKAFTLMEVLVSITIFGIVSISMSSIVLNMVAVSTTTERKNDFLNEINNLTATIKNEMRNAQTFGICKKSNASDPTKFYIKRLDDIDSGGNSVEYSIRENRLVRIELKSSSGLNTGTGCEPVSTNFPSASSRFMTSETIKIQNLKIWDIEDSSLKNKITYISFEACDRDDIKKKIYDCSNQSSKPPYIHTFAMTTRNK